MIFNKLKLYNNYPNIVISPTGYNSKHVALFFMSENSDFLETFPSMRIRPFNVRSVIIPTISRPVYSTLKSDLRKKVQSLKLFPIRAAVGDYSLVDNKNFFINSSPYLNTLDSRYSFKRFNTGKAFNAYKGFINILGGVSSETHERVLIYAINTDRTLPSSITLRKSFVLYKMFIDFYAGRTETLPFEKMIVFTYNTNQSNYYMIYEKDNPRNNLSRIRRVLMNNKFEQSEDPEVETLDEEDVDIDTIADIAAEETISDEKLKLKSPLDTKIEKPKIKPIYKSKIEVKDEEEVEDLDQKPETIERKATLKNTIKNAVKTFLKSSDSKVNVKNPETINYKKLAATSLVYNKVGGNLEKTHRIMSDHPETSHALDNTIKENMENLLPKPPAVSTARNMIVKASGPEKMIKNAVPSHIFEKRKIDFKVNLLNDIYNAFKVLETKNPPLKIVNVKVETIKDGPSEINPSIKDRFYIYMQDIFEKTQMVYIDVPHLTDNNSFYINGQNTVLVTQIVPFPIFFLKSGLGRFESSYSSMSIHSKELQTGAYLILFMGSYKLPLIMYLAYRIGFTEALNMFNITYTLHDTKVANSYILPNKKYIEFTYKDDVGFQNIQGFLKCIPYFDKNMDLENKVFWRTVIEKNTGNRNSTYLLDQMYDNIVTPVERQILKNRHYPTDIKDIIRYISQGVVEGKVDDRNGVDKLRIRTAELFVTLLQKQILAAYNEYSAKVVSGDESAIYYINPSKTFSEIINSQNVQTLENINPLEELSMMTRITPVGIGGIPNTRALTQDSMNVHYTYYGNIDPLETPDSASVGVQQHLAVGAAITDNRGTFLIKDRKTIEPNEILSTTPSMIPFIESNDGIRVAMASGQAKQAISLLNPENPAIQSGYESVLTTYLSDNFMKKSPVDGIVEKVTDLQILIKDKDTKKVLAIDIAPVLLKSGQGKNGYGRFQSIVQVGQKVKKGEIVAEGSNIKDGIISNGINALAAFMPWKGYNFEDGMVISESLAKRLTSLHIEDKKTYLLPEEDVYYIAKLGDVLKKGDVLLTHSPTVYDVETHQNERTEGGKIVNIQIFCNIEESAIPEKLIDAYKDFKERYTLLHGSYPIGKFKEKGIKFNGILVHFTVQQTLSVEVGDKINQRHFNKGIISCFDTKTHVLTENGWKLFKDLTDNDKVAYMKDNGKTGFILPEAYHTYKYKGRMYGCDSRKVNYLVTPTHRMYVSNRDHKWKFETAENTHNKTLCFKTTTDFEYGQYKNEIIKLENNYPSSVKNPVLEFDKKLFYKFMGWYLSEGSTYHRKTNKQSNYRVILTQSNTKSEYVKEISEMLTAMRLTWCREKNGSNFIVSHKPLFTYLNKLGKCLDKYIPEDLFHTHKDNLKELFWGLVKGDGSIRTDKYVEFYTTSAQLKTDFIRLACLLGYNVIEHEPDVRNRKNKKYIIGVQFEKKYNNVYNNKEPYYTVENYNDKVYCLSVKNNLLYVMREGKCMWSGNSIVPDNEMPRLPSGEHIEIVYNGLSVLNRMNPGQLCEMHCGLIAKKLYYFMSTLPRLKFVSLLEPLMKLLDGTKDKSYGKNIISYLKSINEIEYKKIINQLDKDKFFPLIFPPFQSPPRKNILAALKFLNLKPAYKLYLPEYGRYSRDVISVGYLYVFKLEHMVEKKIHVRSTGGYNGPAMLPTRGKRRGGGQAIGEGDAYSLLSWDAPSIITEFFSALSNDHKTKNQMISEVIQTGKTNLKEIKNENPTKELFMAYMTAIHLGSV